jgi:hypothetical protein
MKLLYTFGFLLLSNFCYSQTPMITAHHVLAGNCIALTYGNGLYIASTDRPVASIGRTFTSTNARTWTVLNDSVPPFAYLAFGNGVFVGTTNPDILTTNVYSSSDGIHWTLRTAVPGIVDELNFTGGAFYVVSNYLSEGPSSIAKSGDGINWAGLDLGTINWGSNIINPPLPFTMNSLAYNGSVYVIGVNILASRGDPNGESSVFYSTTGAPGSWNYDDEVAQPGESSIQWVKDRFYLFAFGGVYTSTDGISWGPSAPVDSMLNGSVSPVTGGVFFTAGDSIYLVGGSTLAVSTDGTNFKSLPAPNLQWAGGLAVNGLTLIYGDGGLATATDGIHFTLNGTLFSALATNGSTYVAAGANAASGGDLFTSPDFVTWTDQLPVSYTSTVLYTGSKYVAAGSGNTYFSPDGTTWSTNTVAPSFTAMDYGAGRYVGGSSYNLLSSTDAINWSQVDSSDTYYYKIRYLNNTFFALGADVQAGTGKILQSADGLHWQKVTPQLDTVVAYYNDVMYDSTRYYFTGVNNSGSFFTIATTDPTNTSSYGAMGGINPASGSSAVNYFPQFDDFIYHNGKYVGTVVSSVDGDSYLAYSTDGMNWTTDSLGGSGHGRTTVSASDTFHIVAGDGGYYAVSFANTAPPALLRFEAEAVRSFGGEDSRLRWEMKYDSAIAYFLVQHSQDSVQWDSIGRVNAEKRKEKEERDEKKSPTERYQFTQDGPPSGANYYRLGITDDQGHRWWSAVRKVEIKKDIYIYPNPARDVLHVQLPEPGRSRLIIFNRGWTPVRELAASGYDFSIDLHALSPGYYYLLVLQDGQRYSKEFIIE